MVLEKAEGEVILRALCVMAWVCLCGVGWGGWMVRW